MTIRALMTAGMIAAACLACAAAAPALADDYAAGAVKTMKSGMGEILTDAKGMTLYTFDKDGKDMSNCVDKCAANWPPLTADAGAKAEGDFSLVTRKDGTMQWAKDGKPLYRWIKDTKPGDMTGDGFNGVWHVAKE